MKLKRFKALKGVPSKFPDLPGIKFQEVIPDTVLNALDGTFDLTSPIIKDILDRLGNKASDYPVAVRVAKLQQQYPVAPITELVTYDWLRGQGIPFVYQAALYGGRAQSGGILPDFLIAQGGGWNAIPVQGSYWHSYKINQGQDAGEKLRLLGQDYNGMKIERVTAIWENKIYHFRPMVFEMMLMGVEIPD